MRCAYPACAVFTILASAAFAAEGAVQAIPVVAVKRTGPVVYDKDIQSILREKCVVCHSGAVKKAGLDLSTYETLRKGGQRGATIVPGKSAESLLVKVAGRTGKPFMPPRGESPLTPEELALFKLWIDQGAKAPTATEEQPRTILTVPSSVIRSVLAVTVSPDKSRVAGAWSNHIHIFNPASGAQLRSLVDAKVVLPEKKVLQAAHLSVVESLAFSPEGKLLASGSFREVKLWDVTTGGLLRQWDGFADRVYALAFSPDGKLLATGGGAPTINGEVKVLDVASGKIVTAIPNAHSDTVFGVCFHPNGTRIASCGADQAIHVFDVPSGKLLKSFKGHTHHVMDVAWKSDGKLLASGSADQSVKFWDSENGQQIELPSRQMIQKRVNGLERRGQVSRLVFAGSTLIACSADRTTQFWNIEDGSSCRRLEIKGAAFLHSLGASPDGELVAVGDARGVVWLMERGKLTNKQLVPADRR